MKSLKVVLTLVAVLIWSLVGVRVGQVYAKGSQATTGTWSSMGMDDPNHPGFCYAQRTDDGCTDDINPKHACARDATNRFRHAKIASTPCLMIYCCPNGDPAGDGNTSWTYYDQVAIHNDTIVLP